MVQTEKNRDFSESRARDALIEFVHFDSFQGDNLACVDAPGFIDAAIGALPDFAQLLILEAFIHSIANYLNLLNPNLALQFPNHFKLPVYYKFEQKYISMKDRWKILTISIVLTTLLALLFLFIGFSLKVVTLRDYGLLKYSYFQTVDATQTIRDNGNYLVGLDYAFQLYPKGILKHEFTVSILTKDKSII